MYLLYRDFTDMGGGEGGPVMATVERRDSRVRKRPKGTYMWHSVAEQTKLYRKEYVQTGEGSGAIIKFTDGTTLELKEKSLVIIDDSSQLSLNFVQGEGVLKTADGDSKISIAESGKATVEQLPVKLQSPDGLSDFLSQTSDKKINFAWSLKQKADNLSLEISRTPEFPAKATKSVTVGKKTEATVALTPGEFFWRLAQKGAPMSEVGRFSVHSAPVFRAIFPQANARAEIWGQGGSVAFRWAVIGAASSIFETRLQIAKTSDFTAPVFDEKVAAESGQTPVPGLEPGKYYWRMLSSLKRETVASVAVPFEFGLRQKLQLSLVGPETDSAKPLPGDLRFTWASPDTTGELKYQIEVTREGSSLVEEDVGAAQTWIWKRPKSGTLKWRVSAFWKEQKIGESAWGEFSLFEDKPLKLVRPEPDTKIHFWEDPPTVTFEWKNDPMLSQGDFLYEFQLSTRADFQDFVMKERQKTTEVKDVRLNMKSTQYYWRVLIIGKAGKPVKASDAFSLTYSVFPTLTAPNDGRLGSGLSTFNPMETTSGLPPLQWSKVDDAKAYEISLYQVPQDGAPKLVLQTTTEKPNYQMENLDEGDYRWTIRAIDRLNRKGELSKSQQFSITFGDVLPAPEVESEEVQ